MGVSQPLKDLNVISFEKKVRSLYSGHFFWVPMVSALERFHCMSENTDLYRTNWRKRYFDVLSS